MPNIQCPQNLRLRALNRQCLDKLFRSFAQPARRTSNGGRWVGLRAPGSPYSPRLPGAFSAPVAFQAVTSLKATALSGFRPRSPLRDSAGFSPVFPAPICSRLVTLKAVSIIAVVETQCKALAPKSISETCSAKEHGQCPQYRDTCSLRKASERFVPSSPA
jgi:hypothetical protein